MTQNHNQFFNCSHFCALQSFSTLRKFDIDIVHPEKAIQNTQSSQNQPKVIQSRSKKRVEKAKHQISFETGLLDSHIQAFALLFNRHWQNLYGDSYQMKIDLFAIERQSQDEFTYIQEQVNACSSFSQEEKDQLIQDWRREGNFSKFLKIIMEKLEDAEKQPILVLSSLVWEKYLKFYYWRCKDREKIKKISENLTLNIQNLFQKGKLNRLKCSLLLSEEDIKQSLIDFINSFSQTIYLVLEEYFDNPLCNSDYEKAESRSISVQSPDDSEDFNQSCMLRMPRKMPKLI